MPPTGHIWQVLAVAVQPVDGGEMASRGQRLIQCPETADEALGVLGNRLGEVTAGRRNGPNDADRAKFRVERFDVAVFARGAVPID